MHRSRLFSIVNQKGGVGKTTTAVNLAASFAASERPTLLVDLDPQANASSAFGVAQQPPHIYDALSGACVIKDVVRPTELPYLHIVPSGRDLYGAEIELVSTFNRERRVELRSLPRFIDGQIGRIPQIVKTLAAVTTRVICARFVEFAGCGDGPGDPPGPAGV